MTDNTAASAGDILFNKFAVRAAERKALVQSWMIGATEGHSRTSTNDSRIEEEEEDVETLYLKPDLELAGLGVDLQKLTESERLRLDPNLRSEDASTAFLRERLLGKAAKPVKGAAVSRPTFKLAGVAPGFTPMRRTAPVKTNEVDDGRSDSAQASKTRTEEDEEDEIGRSGIGGEPMSARPKATKTNVMKSSGLVRRDKIIYGNKESIHNGTRETEPKSDASNDESDSKTNAGIHQPKQEAASKKGSRRKAVSYLDELLAQKSAKKQKRRKN